ncbi:MAG: hypothetical protein IJW54_03430 [Clostridia bacterium]|nr:hypothetical protein [Clostridia bacterium]
MMADKIDEIRHDVIIKGRKRMELTGASDVTSFDDKEIVVQVENFGVTIEGENLKIEKFNSENGELILNGLITGMFYFNKDLSKKKKTGGFFK